MLQIQRTSESSPKTRCASAPKTYGARYTPHTRVHSCGFGNLSLHSLRGIVPTSSVHVLHGTGEKSTARNRLRTMRMRTFTHLTSLSVAGTSGSLRQKCLMVSWLPMMQTTMESKISVCSTTLRTFRRSHKCNVKHAFHTTYSYTFTANRLYRRLNMVNWTSQPDAFIIELEGLSEVSLCMMGLYTLLTVTFTWCPSLQTFWACAAQMVYSNSGYILCMTWQIHFTHSLAWCRCWLTS